MASITFSDINQWGKFDITLGGITIKGCKHVATDKYDFIALPSRKMTDKDGNPKKGKNGKDLYASDVTWTKELEARVLEAFHEAFDDATEDGTADQEDIPF